MIVDAFLNLIFYVLSSFIGLLPTGGSLPPAILSSAQTIAGFGSIWTPILPYSTLFAVITMVIAVELAIWGFKSFMWIIKTIRG